MSLDDLKDEWKNQPEAGLKMSSAAIEELIRETKRGRRVRLLVLFGCGIALTVATAVIGMALNKGGLSLVLEAWPVLLTQLAALAVFGVMGWRRVRLDRGVAGRTLPVRRSLEWSLEETQGRMADLRMLAWYAGAAIVLTVFGVAGLLQSGKMAPAHAVSFGLLFGTIVGLQILVQRHRYWHELAPRRDRLTQILRTWQQ